MREVKVGTFEVKAEVNRTMIEDLNNMRSFDFTAKLYALFCHFILY